MLEPVSALQALQANAQLIELLSGRRWYVMQAAARKVRSGAEIGAALGVSKQAAREFHKRKIEDQQTYAPISSTPTALGLPLTLTGALVDQLCDDRLDGSTYLG